jgi:hypothetical protein
MTTTTLTYRDDEDLKARLIANMTRHRDADRLQKGLYFGSDPDLDGIEPKGCAVGCTVADFRAAERGITLVELAAAGMSSCHSEWARVTGLPEWLAHLDDYLFENLPAAASREWPLRLLESVPVGVDLKVAREAWLRDLVFDAEHGALASAAAGLEAAGLAPEAARLRGLPPTTDWSAASDAAWAASDAAWAASNAAWAASNAAWAARNAAGAASNAAGAASNAAWAASNAAWAASNEWVAERLLHHLAAAQPPTA